MEINSERIAILKLLEDKENISSRNIAKETEIPIEHVLKELKYLKQMDQIQWHIILGDAKIIGIKLTQEGQKTLEVNRSTWSKLKSKIKGFNIGPHGLGINLDS